MSDVLLPHPVTGELYLVYADNPAGTDKADIFLRRSSDGGATWSQLTAPSPASFVASPVGKDGSVLLANQAGMLLRAAPGKPVVPLRLPPLAPLSDVLPQPDGAIVAGMEPVCPTMSPLA